MLAQISIKIIVASEACCGSFVFEGLMVGEQYDYSGELVEHCKFGYECRVVKSIPVARDKIFSAHQDHRIKVWKWSRAPWDSSLHHNHICRIPTVKDYMLNFMSPKK